MGSTVYLCYEVTQYSELALVLLLALSTSLLHNKKTVLPVSTHLLKKFCHSFLFSLLMSSTAMLTEIKCDSLHYLAVLSLNRISISVQTDF